MTRSCTTFFSGTLPARIVCAVLSIVSLALISILRYEHDRDNFKIPMALVCPLFRRHFDYSASANPPQAIVAMAWFITAAGMAVYVWYGSIAFCPRRAASLAIGGLVAVGCCIGTAIVVGLSDPAATVEARRLENSLIGMQISAA